MAVLASGAENPTTRTRFEPLRVAALAERFEAVRKKA
jgi:hypothetical protein